MSLNISPMGITSQALAAGLFLIKTDDERRVLHAPLQGVAMEVNDAYVDGFRKALAGDTGSAQALGLDPVMLQTFAGVPPALASRLEPKWGSAFEPTNVTLFLTHKCTMRCAYCYCHGGEGQDMPWPVLEKAVRFTVDNAHRMGRAVNLGIHGGDVGACWSLFEKAVGFTDQTCGEAGVKCRKAIGTNGLYSSEKAAYIAAHFQSATVSIDGAHAVHDRYRCTAAGGPTLDRVLETTRVFKRDGLEFSVRMTVTADGVSSLADDVAFICKNTGVKSIRAEPLYNRGRAAEQRLAAPEPAAFVDAFRAARQVAHAHGCELSYSAARLFGVYCSFCSYPEPTFGVTPEGNLSCCYEILHPDDPLCDPFFYGSIPPDGSRINVDLARVTNIREWSQQRRAACTDCFCVYGCAGDCAAKVMDSGPEQPGRLRRCQITRALSLDMLDEVLSGHIRRRGEAFPTICDAPAVAACDCVDCAGKATPRG